jgi:hypothetical protein
MELTIRKEGRKWELKVTGAQTFHIGVLRIGYETYRY